MPAADFLLRDFHQAGEHVVRGVPPAVQRAHLPEETERPGRQWNGALVLREVGDRHTPCERMRATRSTQTVGQIATERWRVALIEICWNAVERFLL